MEAENNNEENVYEEAAVNEKFRGLAFSKNYFSTQCFKFKQPCSRSRSR